MTQKKPLVEKKKPGPKKAPRKPHQRKPVAASAPLSAIEQRFVAEYLTDYNGGAAYLRASPNVTTIESARVRAAEMLTRRNVRRAITVAKRRYMRRAGVGATETIMELARVGFSDIGNIVTIDEHGNVSLRPGSTIPPEERRAIKSLTVGKPVVTGRGKYRKVYTPLKIVLYDKLAALDKLAKHVGLFQDLPPLEQLLQALSPDIAKVVRRALVAAVHAGPDPSSSSTNGTTHELGPRTTPDGPGVPDPCEAAFPPVLPTGRGNDLLGGEDLGPLFDS